MSTLIAIAHPDRDTAEQVREELIRATKEQPVRGAHHLDDLR